MSRLKQYKLGSKDEALTLEAILRYRQAKRQGKTTLIVAAGEKTKLQLIVNHGVDPNDIVTKAEMNLIQASLN